MNIGQLNHRLSIEQPVLAPDGGGGFTVAWQEVAEIYAAISELAGGELLQNGMITPSAPCRITILHRSDMREDMRLTGNGRIYEIVSLRDPDGKNTYLEVIARVA